MTVTQALPPPDQAQRPAGEGDRHVTFPGLAPGQAATVVATTRPGPRPRRSHPRSDGTATVTLAVGHLTPAQPVTVTARAPHQTCQAALSPPHPAGPHLPQPLTFDWQAISYHLAALAARPQSPADRLRQPQARSGSLSATSCGGYPGGCAAQVRDDDRLLGDDHLGSCKTSVFAAYGPRQAPRSPGHLPATCGLREESML